MGKRASVISIAKMGDGYVVDARGAFGGGYRRPVKADELKSAIVRAWQQYGDNPLGCQIIGDFPSDIKTLVDDLHSAAGGDKQVITLRLPATEAMLVRQAAEAAGLSVNEWARRRLVVVSVD